MHLVSCRIRDEIRIGESVTVSVLDFADDHVRLGVNTPGKVPEYQEEVIYLAQASDSPRQSTADRHVPAERLVEI